MKWKWQVELDKRLVKSIITYEGEIKKLNDVLHNPVYVMRVFTEILIHHNKLRKFGGPELKDRGYLLVKYFSVGYHDVDLYYKWDEGEDVVVWEVNVHRKDCLVYMHTLFRLWL